MHSPESKLVADRQREFFALYGSQAAHRRPVSRQAETDQRRKAARSRSRHIEVVLHGLILFFSVHTAIFGFHGTLAVTAVGALVGQLWHWSNADRDSAATIAAVAYVAIALVSVSFGYWIFAAAGIVGALGGLMAYQRTRSAFGA